MPQQFPHQANMIPILLFFRFFEPQAPLPRTGLAEAGYPESAETRHPGLGLGERGGEGGGSKKVEKKQFSELGLPGVEIVPTPQESIFIISRAP